MFSERLNYLSLAWDYKRIAHRALEQGDKKLAKNACINAIRSYEGCHSISKGNYLSDALKLAKDIGVESEVKRLEKLLEENK